MQYTDADYRTKDVSSFLNIHMSSYANSNDKGIMQSINMSYPQS